MAWANGISLAAVPDQREAWFRQTTYPPVAVAFHPESKSVAAGLANGNILIFDAQTGEAETFAGAEPQAYSGDVAWSPDGQRVAFQFIGAREGDPIQILNLSTGTVHRVPNSRIQPNTQPLLLWSPDGERIASADTIGLGQILDIETGEVIFRLASENPEYRSVISAWSPDGSLVAYVAEGNTIQITNVQTGETVKTLAATHTDFSPRPPLAFSPDGKRLLSGGGFNLLDEVRHSYLVWDTETGALLGPLGEEETFDQSKDVFFLPEWVPFAFDGRELLILYSDGEIARWSLGLTDKTVVGHLPLLVARGPLTWSPDGRRLAVSNVFGGVAIWDVETNRLDGLLHAGASPVAFSPANSSIVAFRNTAKKALTVWNIEAEEAVATFAAEPTDFPGSIAFSPDGAEMAYGSKNMVIVIDITSGKESASLIGHPGHQVISRVIWSPDGDALVTASGAPGNDNAPGPLVLWQRHEDGSFEEVFRTETARAGYDCCVPLALFNPTGDLVALERVPRLEAGWIEIVIYDREARKAIQTLKEYQMAAWVSDEVLLTSETQYATRLTQWNVRTGERTIGFGDVSGNNVYAPGGIYYAVQRSQRPDIARVVEIHHWKTARIIAAGYHGSNLLEIAWSPDGRWIASLGADGVIKVWAVNLPVHLGS